MINEFLEGKEDTNMPELPEVETVRKGLVQLVADKTISKVKVSWPNIITTDESLELWEEMLVGQTIQSVGRRGKYLVFEMTDWLLISHLRMEGKYLFFKQEDLPEAPNKHTHVRFTFTDGSQLHYHDVRKFGRMERILNTDQTYAAYFEHRKLGPEPIRGEFNLSVFKEQLGRINRAIKPTLLDQKLVVGLGNIYVDEALFRSSIHPATPAKKLTQAQIEVLYNAIIQVLEEAVTAGGSTIRTYKNTLGEAGEFQTALAVYGRQGEECVRCGHEIMKQQLAQRGTHFCPQCQPLLDEEL